MNNFITVHDVGGVGGGILPRLINMNHVVIVTPILDDYDLGRSQCRSLVLLMTGGENRVLHCKESLEEIQVLLNRQ